MAAGQKLTLAVEKRLETVLVELECAQLPGAHDHVIVSDDLDRTYVLFLSRSHSETQSLAIRYLR